MNYPSLSLSKESIEGAFKMATENDEKKTFQKRPAFKDKFSSGDAQKCESCDFKTPKHEQMRQHILIKHSGVKNKCTYCDYTHYYPNRVKIHENQIHKKIPRISGKKNMVCFDIQCPHFRTKECDFLENHGRHLCTKCKFATKRTSDLKLHTEKVHDGVVFSCEECQYSIASKRRLTLHIRSEHEGVVFSCKLCDATLKTEEYLKRHTMRKHAFKKHE